MQCSSPISQYFSTAVWTPAVLSVKVSCAAPPGPAAPGRPWLGALIQASLIVPTIVSSSPSNAAVSACCRCCGIGERPASPSHGVGTAMARRRRSGRPRDGCCGGTFRCIFLFLNWLLAAAGLTLIGFSTYAAIEIANPPAGYPSGSSACSDVAPVAGGSGGLRDGPEDEWKEETKRYWFALLIAAIGIWALITAVFGLGGGRCRNGCCVGTHSVLLSLGLLAEVAFGIVFYFEQGWKWELPPEASGQCAAFHKFVDSHLRMSMYVGAGVLVLEVLTLLLGCALWPRPSRRAVYVEEPLEDVEEPLVPKALPAVCYPPTV
ncbi:unnamed protein product [Ostreobium quekettii]|uniref:Uncharacterized protein n=1 Tax=Ostreobium quekettii TaxID=121088 RepID=A0A8S1IKM7_9CHLO|nr:unnamed protein product [Ostreobium quekettii]